MYDYLISIGNIHPHMLRVGPTFLVICIKATIHSVTLSSCCFDVCHCYSKLLRDMKTTDLEELKLQLEMYHQEVRYNLSVAILMLVQLSYSCCSFCFQVLRLRQANADQDVPDGLPPSARYINHCNFCNVTFV